MALPTLGHTALSACQHLHGTADQRHYLVHSALVLLSWYCLGLIRISNIAADA